MKKFSMIASLAVLAFALAACGGGNSAGNAGSASGGASSGNAADAGADTAGQEVVIKATNFEFDQPEYRVAKGEAVTFTLKNEEGMHGIEIANIGVKLEDGKSQTVTINDAGEYEIRCNIPCGTGHATMVSKLIVE